MKYKLIIRMLDKELLPLLRTKGFQGKSVAKLYLKRDRYSLYLVIENLLYGSGPDDFLHIRAGWVPDFKPLNQHLALLSICNIQRGYTEDMTSLFLLNYLQDPFLCNFPQAPPRNSATGGPEGTIVDDKSPYYEYGEKSPEEILQDMSAIVEEMMGWAENRTMEDVLQVAEDGLSQMQLPSKDAMLPLTWRLLACVVLDKREEVPAILSQLSNPANYINPDIFKHFSREYPILKGDWNVR